MGSNRNKPCRCGSGKKTKKCCGDDKILLNYEHPLTPNRKYRNENTPFQIDKSDAKAEIIRLLDSYMKKLDDPNTTKPEIERFCRSLVATAHELKCQAEQLNINQNELTLFATIAADPLKTSLFDGGHYPLSAVSIGYKSSAEMCKRALLAGIQAKPALCSAVITTTTGWKVVDYELEFSEYELADEIMITTNPLDEEDFQLYHLRKKFYFFESESLQSLAKVEAFQEAEDSSLLEVDDYTEWIRYLSDVLYRETLGVFTKLGLTPMPTDFKSCIETMKDGVFKESPWHNATIYPVFNELLKAEELMNEQQPIPYDLYKKIYDICLNRFLLGYLNELKQSLMLQEVKPGGVR